MTYVGSQCSGNMTNGNNEGHPGDVIGTMEKFSQPDLSMRPNVVLLYVGTNDMLYPVDPINAPRRMAALVRYLAKALPEATIIANTLFIDTDPKVQARIDAFNKGVGPVIAGLAANGTKTLLADFSQALTVDDLFCDGEHPNDSGYAKMANVFHSALLRAASLGWISEPVDTKATSKRCRPLAAPGAGTCSSTANSTIHTSNSTHAGTSIHSTTSTSMHHTTGTTP